MKTEPDSGKTAPPKRTMKFTPRIPPRKLPKPEVTKTEPSETKNDFIDKELLLKLNSAKQSHDGFGRRIPKAEKKVVPAQDVFGYGHASTLARSFGNPKGGVKGNEEGLDVSASKLEKEYIEPWDYFHSYYPTTLPLREPHSGNPEILDQEEFGEASASSAPGETRINPAVELGLMEKLEEPQMLFLQLPANLPLMKRPAAAVESKPAAGKIPKKGCRLEELPAGYMGKLLVYKSGIVKMKLGDALFDVSPGAKRIFAQDVAAISTREKHCCILGELTRRAVVTPDVDSLVDSLDDMAI